MWLLYATAALLGVGILFRVLTVISKFFNRPSREEIATLIERHLTGTDNAWDWDDFVCVPIRDRELEQIRLRCLELDDLPMFDRNPELTRIIDELRHQRE